MSPPISPDTFLRNAMRRILQCLLPKASVQAQSRVEIETSTSDGYSWIPDWPGILGDDWQLWAQAVQRDKGGPKVLIATIVGGNTWLTPIETLFAVALTMRGAEVHFILCDKKLPACQNCFAGDEAGQESFVENGPSGCNWCYDVGMRALSQLGLPIHQYSSYAEVADFDRARAMAEGMSLADIFAFKLDGIEHSETVRAAVLRYFGRCDLENESLVLPVARRYLYSSIVTNWALTKLLEQESFDHIVSNQGIYVPQGNLVAVAKKLKKHLVVFDTGYRKNCYNVCHTETHIHSYLNEPVERWESLPWNEAMERRITQYLEGRWSSKYDWLKVITEGENSTPDEVAALIGLDQSKPTVGLLTNVLWDGQLCYPANAFESQLEWIIETIKYFEQRQEVQLLIRVHPSEHDSWIKSRQHVVDEINRHFKKLPPNVFIVAPDSKINTYKAMMNCDTVLIYGTTAGLEMVCMGIPVIAAGESWIRTKGLCTAVSSPEEYKLALDTLPAGQRLEEPKRQKALKYAYHFYLRQMIPLHVLEAEPQPGGTPFKIRQQPLSNFAAGGDKGLDVICTGILEEEPFIYPTEELDAQDVTEEVRQFNDLLTLPTAVSTTAGVNALERRE